jgi:hypothetical protein
VLATATRMHGRGVPMLRPRPGGLRPRLLHPVGPLKIDRVDPGQRHELRDVHDRRRRVREGPQLLFGHGHVPVLGHLVPFDQLAARHRPDCPCR